MQYIMQLGNGKMLVEDNGEFHIEETGYPYPDCEYNGIKGQHAIAERIFGIDTTNFRLLMTSVENFVANNKVSFTDLYSGASANVTSSSFSKNTCQSNYDEILEQLKIGKSQSTYDLLSYCINNKICIEDVFNMYPNTDCKYGFLIRISPASSLGVIFNFFKQLNKLASFHYSAALYRDINYSLGQEAMVSSFLHSINPSDCILHVYPTFTESLDLMQYLCSYDGDEIDYEDLDFNNFYDDIVYKNKSHENQLGIQEIEFHFEYKAILSDERYPQRDINMQYKVIHLN